MQCQIFSFLLSLSQQVVLSVKYSNQSAKQGLIYSIQGLLSRKHPQVERSFQFIDLQRHELEL